MGAAPGEGDTWGHRRLLSSPFFFFFFLIKWLKAFPFLDLEASLFFILKDV